MHDLIPTSYSAFAGFDRFAQGTLEDVVLKTRKHLKANPSASLLIFSDLTGKEMDFDLRGTEKEVLQRLEVYLPPTAPKDAPAGPGRPRLGVIAREVSLLPRHWEWLANQSGGASASLRRLVESEMKSGSNPRGAIKQAQERTFRFLTAIAGNLPHFEEAMRALFAADRKKFKDRMQSWPEDVRNHALELAAPAFD